MSTSRLVALVAASFAARLPVTAIGLGIVLLAREADRTYSLAGVATGAFTLGLAITAPLLARLADRVGPSRVIAAGSGACAAAIATLAVSADDLPAIGYIALALVAGATLPPLASVLRAFLPALVDPGRLRRLYALDATTQEFLFVLGPVFLAALVALFSARTALLVFAAGLVLGGLAFAVAARHVVRAADAADAFGSPPLSSAALRSLLAVSVSMGLLFGAVEVSVTAALEAAGDRAASGLVLGVWSFGSLCGGAVLALRAHGAPDLRLHRLVLGIALTALPLGILAGAPAALTAALFIQGLFIAPTLATSYQLVPRLAESRLTEAFAWLSTGILSGVAVGAAVTGAAIGATGRSSTGFMIASFAAAAAWVASLRVRPPLLPATSPRSPRSS